MSSTSIRLAALLGASCSLLVACQGEPDLACKRLRYSFPLLDLDASQDEDPAAEGIQLSFRVESDLPRGEEANLFVIQGETQTFVGAAIADAVGGLYFERVTLPLGSITLLAEATDSCGRHRAGYREYVWDGQGKPQCQLSLNKQPPQAAVGEIPVLSSEYDEEPSEPGMQVRVLIDAGRPDMDVRLFLVDRETGESRDISMPLNSSGRAAETVTLPVGEQAMRATCLWELEDLVPSSATWVFDVQPDPEP